ncbi:Gmad2 immunoglobulin-like domain-containing protein [Brevibacillus sp. SYSU BS000544]|uniref:Gmad2 immunoglobulin-like domain-containing protein n=1 Tax=Brevibacillus sp. SYSU BS000544 TaxID=3416443 RepID=UPI003CE5C3AF
MIVLIVAGLLQGCLPLEKASRNNNSTNQNTAPVNTQPEQPQPEQPQPATPEQPTNGQQPATETVQPTKPAKEEQQPKVYGNETFQNVTVKKVKENTYEVKGKARVFEATFGYVVEDGHNELKKGFVTASAGAPEFGDFQFTIEVAKAEPNSTLMLILFEESAKDGSRIHELPIPLPDK